jgi:hypothetical protein
MSGQHGTGGVSALTACAREGGRLILCDEVRREAEPRLRAADLAELEGPGHRVCAEALRRTAARYIARHIAEAGPPGARDQ